MSSSLEGVNPRDQLDVPHGSPVEGGLGQADVKQDAGEQLAHLALQHNQDPHHALEHVVSNMEATVGDQMQAVDHLAAVVPGMDPRKTKREILIRALHAKRTERRRSASRRLRTYLT